MSLSLNDLDITVAGTALNTGDLELNTALAIGSDPVKLAAKISGWCESHAFVEGPDRAWMAGIIDEGLRTAVFRRGMWYVDGPCDGPPEKQPNRKWADQGWGAVLDLLRSRDDEPVVLSYSVCDQFPNEELANWSPPAMPEGWAPDWARSEEGRAEWERDFPDDESRRLHYFEEAHNLWDEVPDEEQWRLAMAGLRRDRWWARLGPDTLATVTFRLGVTVYDLFAPDRDERIIAAAREEEANTPDAKAAVDGGASDA